MVFAIVSVLGIVLQVDAAGGGPDQKADAMPSDPATLATIKGAIALARKGELAQASDVKESISDPVARKVVEWAILCSGNNEVDFQRYVAFISDNPGWPNIGLLRRRAEAALWKERLDPPTVRAYFDKDQPLTAQGKFALARALLLEGDRADAQNLVREAWRYDNFSGDLEAQILDVFRDLITDTDHKTRMDMRLYAEDVDAAMRSANRAAGNARVIAIARIAVIKKAADAKAQLDGVPAEARGDIGYIFSRAQWLRREGKATKAAELILSVPDDPTQALDRDQWWIERRFVSRTLLRDRFSPDAWRALTDLFELINAPIDYPPTESAIFERTNGALRIIASFSGLAQENMSRLAGWRFLELGRRIERAIATCRFVRQFAFAKLDGALDVLLELADSQITYRLRYVMVAAPAPVIDLVVLDPNNPRSLAYQLARIEAHLAALPQRNDDGRLSPPEQIATALATQIRTANAAALDAPTFLAAEEALMKLADLIASTYFTTHERAEVRWEALG